VVRLRRITGRFVGKALGNFEQVCMVDKRIAVSFNFIMIGVLRVLVGCGCYGPIFVSKIALSCGLLPFTILAEGGI
jgi:hypothetical protein